MCWGYVAPDWLCPGFTMVTATDGHVVNNLIHSTSVQRCVLETGAETLIWRRDMAPELRAALFEEIHSTKK